jgi:hypothetical protein
MRCLKRTLWLCCALLLACSVDRMPLTSESLVADAADLDAGTPDAEVDAASTPDAAGGAMLNQVTPAQTLRSMPPRKMQRSRTRVWMPARAPMPG